MRQRSGRLRFNILLSAEVVEWQTRTFEGRVAQAVRVQVPPSAPTFFSRPAGPVMSALPPRRSFAVRFDLDI